jgi:hypothetical protein
VIEAGGGSVGVAEEALFLFLLNGAVEAVEGSVEQDGLVNVVLEFVGKVRGLSPEGIWAHTDDVGAKLNLVGTAMNRRQTIRREGFSKDKVHPGMDGHLLLATSILKGLRSRGA